MKLIFAILLTAFASVSFAQNIDKIVDAKEVSRIEHALASDEMQGRKTFTPSIDRAADFIASEFKKSGLQYFEGLPGYRQTFSLIKGTTVSASGNLDGKPIAAENIIAITTAADLNINENSAFKMAVIDDTSNLFREAYRILKSNQKYVVWVNTAHQKNFDQLKRFSRESFEEKAPVIFVLINENPTAFHFEIKNNITASSLANDRHIAWEK